MIKSVRGIVASFGFGKSTFKAALVIGALSSVATFSLVGINPFINAEPPTFDLAVDINQDITCSTPNNCTLDITLKNNSEQLIRGPFIIGLTTETRDISISSIDQTKTWACDGDTLNITCNAPAISLAPKQSTSFKLDITKPTESQSFANTALLQNVCASNVWLGARTPGTSKIFRTAAMQRSLVDLGYETGEINGLNTVKTQTAFEDFAQKNDLSINSGRDLREINKKLFGLASNRSGDLNEDNDTTCTIINANEIIRLAQLNQQLAETTLKPATETIIANTTDVKNNQNSSANGNSAKTETAEIVLKEENLPKLGLPAISAKIETSSQTAELTTEALPKLGLNNTATKPFFEPETEQDQSQQAKQNALPRLASLSPADETIVPQPEPSIEQQSKAIALSASEKNGKVVNVITGQDKEKVVTIKTAENTTEQTNITTSKTAHQNIINITTTPVPNKTTEDETTNKAKTLKIIRGKPVTEDNTHKTVGRTKANVIFLSALPEKHIPVVVYHLYPKAGTRIITLDKNAAKPEDLPIVLPNPKGVAELPKTLKDKLPDIIRPR